MSTNEVIGINMVKSEEFPWGVCRICLVETDCQDIFELVYEGQNIVDIFNVCTGIKLVRKCNDLDYVCISCISELIQAYEFIKRCQTSNEFLISGEGTVEKNILEDDLIKTEEIYIEITEEEIIKSKQENIDKNKITLNNYDCPICLRKYATWTGLKRHSSIHETSNENEEKTIKTEEIDVHLDNYKCTECTKEFSTSAGLKNHSRLHENTEEITTNTKEITKEEIKQKYEYKCPLCPKEFSTSAGFKNHFNTHERAEERKNEKDSAERKILDEEIKQLKSCRKCPKCGKDFSTVAGLKIHYRSHSNKSRAFTCKVCLKTFSSKKNRGQHMLTHSNERPFRCHECHRGFRQKHALQTHMLLHSGERSVICEFCASKFKEIKDLKYHQSHGDCATVTTEKLQPRMCKICLIPLISYRALQQHNSKVHTKKEFHCKECGNGFISLWGVKQHMKTHNFERPHACTFCDKRFLTKNSLQRHTHLHTGTKPFHCEICKKSFVQKHQLIIHIRSHKGERLYTCQICSKSFSQKNYLTVHIRTHTGESPFMCDACGVRFHDLSMLKKHRLKHDLVTVKTPNKLKDFK